MENNVKKALENFIGISEEDEKMTDKSLKSKKVILDEREGLIERIDHQYVTSDGRMLLREQY